MPAHERYAAEVDLPIGRIIRQVDEPISVGTMLWVLTDPHRGHERAYNRWYERDHYYGGCMIGAHTFAGSRWVAPRRYRDVRFPDPGPMPFGVDAGTYACLYWILDGHHDDWMDWSTPQVHALYAADRGFEPRTHYNTATYRHASHAHRDADPVPLELALDHRYPGMVAVFVDPAAEATTEEVDEWFDAHLPRWLPGGPVETVSSWRQIPLLDTKPDFVPVDPAGDRRMLHVHFLDRDPLEAWDRYRSLAADLTASGVATVAAAMPFIPTVVGTDRHVDELW